MRLDHLTKGLPIDIDGNAAAVDITDVVEDSRRANPGALFIARPGTVDHGRRFVDDAVARGARAVLIDRSAACERLGVAVLRCDDVRRTGAVVAERFHGDPSRRLALVGVTGTNGKTTVAGLLHQILAHAGLRCGVIGTVGTIPDGRTVEPALLTTPPAVETSALLARMVAGECRACVMEVSSHALEQERTVGLEFAGGIFTNLSGDHLDYHGTMEDYGAAKSRLFESLEPGAWAVINADDPVAPRMIEACRGRVLTTSLVDRDAVCRAEVGQLAMTRTECTMRGPWGAFAVALPLPGRHNVANALQAAAAAHALGVAGEALQAALATCHAPAGRLEAVTATTDDFTVLVDYAHTDDALENVLRSLRAIVPTGGRLCVLFGCGGDRDRSKRPRMATAAWRWADRVVVTSDNPRTEDPGAIIAEIMTGVPAGRRSETLCLVDRAEAIWAVIRTATARDVVLIAGKGHEDYQVIGRERRPFDDRVIARSALAARRDGMPRLVTVPRPAGISRSSP